MPTIKCVAIILCDQHQLDQNRPKPAKCAHLLQPGDSLVTGEHNIRFFFHTHSASPRNDNHRVSDLQAMLVLEGPNVGVFCIHA